jgi:hypothetical protein
MKCISHCSLPWPTVYQRKHRVQLSKISCDDDVWLNI